MTLTVYTARIGYHGADVLDVTRKSGWGDGLAFAPGWGILIPARVERRTYENDCRFVRSAAPDAETLRADLAAVERRWREAWETYVAAFLREMRASYAADRGPWARLLAQKSVTLLCYCRDAEHCHRTILAREVLPKLGAVYAGERDAGDGPLLPGVSR